MVPAPPVSQAEVIVRLSWRLPEHIDLLNSPMALESTGLVDPQYPEQWQVYIKIPVPGYMIWMAV